MTGAEALGGGISLLNLTTPLPKPLVAPQGEGKQGTGRQPAAIVKMVQTI